MKIIYWFIFIILLFGFQDLGMAVVYDTSVRPGAEGPPTEVKVGIFVVDIVKINEVSESFEADFSVILRWKDKRLADPSRSNSIKMRLDEIWLPKVTFVNPRQLNKLIEPNILVSQDGSVQYSQRYLGILAMSLDLRDFPFDSQDLPIHLYSRDWIDQVILVPDKDRTGQLKSAGLPGWTLQEIDVAKAMKSISVFEYRASAVLFYLGMDRKPGFHILKLFFPLIMIVVMASMVFWIDPQHFGVQMGVATASAFTLMAFLVSLGRLMPPVTYLTRVDKITIGCMCLVFGALLESVATSRLGQIGRHEMAKKIDKLMRLVYPVLTVTLFTAIILIK